ncbi:hypothetical protein [Parasutterella excrementihominis]|jgi:hypothetical protein|nr:hypothetical protein [Parasutterella excrementihominis]MTT94239.1 hypothetical protein [Parasutterella excrementihominis]
MKVIIPERAISIMEKLLFNEKGRMRMWAQCALWMVVVIEAAFVWSLIR